MKILLIILISVSQCFAIDITPVKKNDPAPKDGFFVDSNNMKELRKINEDKKNLEKQNEVLKELGKLQEKKTNIYKNHVVNVEKAYQVEKTKSDIKGVWGFVLGVLATSVAVFATRKTLD
jgi:hypothetical protein